MENSEIDGITKHLICVLRNLFAGPKLLWTVTAAMKLKDVCYLEGQHIKKQRHCFANKDLSSQSYGFSSSHVWM